MDKSTKGLQWLCLITMCIMSVLVIGILVFLNVEERMKFEGKDDDMSLYGMGRYVLSEIQLSTEEEFVPNPEGEADGISFEASLTSRDWMLREQAGLTNATILNCMRNVIRFKYAYSLLDLELRQLYAEMYLILLNGASDVPLCSNNLVDVKYVAECIYTDCPEFFYHYGYEYVSSKLGDVVVKINYSPCYSMNPDEIRQMQAHINGYAANCFAGINTAADDYHKVKYVYEYLIFTTDYDETVEHNQTICSVALYNRSVCLGYARMMQYLLQELAIETAIVIGKNEQGVSHAWNLVKLGNAYYYVDPTWGDASYQQAGEQERLSVINYDYLCVTTDELLQTHIIESRIPMPRCVFQHDNYYVREGCYVSMIDIKHFEEAFRAGTTADGTISIKCKDAKVFEDTGKFLIEEGNLYRFVRNSSGQVQYTMNENMYTYTFFQ